MDFLHYVNIRQGTASEPRFSTGNTLPLVAAPWGMNAFALRPAQRTVAGSTTRPTGNARACG